MTDHDHDYTTPATEIHAFFYVDDGGEEGIPAVTLNDGPVAYPLIATDRIRLGELEELAHAMAQHYGARLEHVVFTTRTHVKWIDP